MRSACRHGCLIRSVLGNLDVSGNADKAMLVQHAEEARNPIGVRNLLRRKHASIYK